MNQCMQAADHMGIKQSSQKRRSSDDLGGHAKRIAFPPAQFEPPGGGTSVLSAASSHKPILPRPSSEVQPLPQSQPHFQAQAPGPKRRGRPPRSERALPRPSLPQIAPRPSEQNLDGATSLSTYASLSPYANPSSSVAAIGRYSTSPTPAEHQGQSRKGRQQRATTAETPSYLSPSLDAARSHVFTPRVLPESTTGHSDGTRPVTAPNPTPIEPSLRSGAPAREIPHGMSPSFSHLLDRGSQLAPVGSSHSEGQAPLASSA